MDITFLGFKFRLEILILIVIIFWVMFGHMMCSCSRVSMSEAMTLLSPANIRETFSGANKTPMGPSYADSKGSGYISNPTSWSKPLGEDSNFNSGAKPMMNDSMDIFAKTPFKPECCPSAYSNSEGCACMSKGQYELIKTRGNNNVPYSDTGI